MTLKEKYNANMEFTSKLRTYCENHICNQSAASNTPKCDLSTCEAHVGEVSFDNFKKIMEYEPPVDWSKVPVDAKIYVRGYEEDDWEKRHFSKYLNGRVYAFLGGKTSFSVTHGNDELSWNYAKLAEVEDDK